MQTLTDILNTKVSLQANTWTEIASELTIEAVLNQIKSDKHKRQIEDLRNKLEQGDKEYYDNYKKRLPAVTFSATFNSRRTNEHLKSYNPLIVIDIDKLDTQQLKTTYDDLIGDPYVFSFWRSPSNNGYKGIVAIDYQINEAEIDLVGKHKSAFKKLSDYFLEKYGIELDKSGSDITRLCFLTFDIFLVQKLIFDNFIVTNEDLIVNVKSTANKNVKLSFASNLDALYNPRGKNNQFDRKIMTDIIRYLRNKKYSITHNYEEWCKVAMAIANTFTYEIGLNYFLKLSSLDSDKYNEIACTNFLINCYETRKGNINFSSLVYLANQKGYKTKYQKNGVPKTD
ncbi:MAG: PriCT-2 domain-containing protein [Bacteroidales bacterium]|nr:PriCT-2 domain-containing protein [Bacteroidales bacterium]